MDHEKTDNCAKENVSAENTRRRNSNDDRKESKRCIGYCIEEAEPVGTAESETRDLSQRFDKTHHKTGSNDSRKDRNENIADRFQKTDVPRLLRSCGCLCLFLGSGGYTCDIKELVIDFVDCTGSDDQLQLSIGLEHTLNAVDILKRFLVDFAVIGDNETKSGSAMRCRGYIRATADIISDLLRALSVIQCHNFSSLILET